MEKARDLSSLLEQLRMTKLGRDALQEQLELRNCALDSAGSHFMITDATRRPTPIVYANLALARDHGYEREELIGADPSLLAPPDLNPLLLEQIEAATRNGDNLRTEVRARRKDGSIFWTGVLFCPVRDNAGRVTHYVSIGADITTRLEEAQNKQQLLDQLYSEMQERERMAIELRFAQKLEAVGQLAAGIAHEINTPIQYVGDSISFLQQAADDYRIVFAAYQEALQRISAGTPVESELDRLRQLEKDVDLPFLRQEVPKAFARTLDGVGRVAEIVRAMKEFAHRDAGEQNAADINHAVETTLTVARNEYKYAATIETEFGALPEVTCNIGELNQVFLNLIVNAAHAIAAGGKDAGSGRIRISTAVEESWVILRFEDNGCGISEQNLERVFDPFFTTKEVGKGTGQGLAIARSIVVEKHGGTIQVQSVVGEGTTFSVRLPIAGRPPDAPGMEIP
jgi:PAS domain S-box-containing protein